MKINCSNCKFENPSDAKFCLECGQRMKRSADPLVGQQIGNHRLLERIGVGGMGVIYRAEHINLGKTYAIKFLHPQFAADEEVVERFRREAQVIASLDHENIVRETDFGWLDGVGFYLVMEFLKGETLKEVIKREGALPPERVLKIFEQLLDALDVAHEEGVVHRDLKPENLFLIKRRGKEQLKILDFGIARIVFGNDRRDEFTVDGEVYGSPSYMSPEQARGDISKVDPRSDLYSAGVILVEALTGRPPYRGNTPAEVMLAHISVLPPRVSDLKPDLLFAPELEDVVIKSLSKESEDRYQSAHEFWAALESTMQRTIELRKTSAPTNKGPSTRELKKVPPPNLEQKTGKMVGQTSSEWFLTNSGVGQPAPSLEIPASRPEQTAPPEPGEAGWAPPTFLDGASPPSPLAGPLSPPNPSSGANLTDSVAGSVSLQQQQQSMTPTPSYKQSVTGHGTYHPVPSAQVPHAFLMDPSTSAAPSSGHNYAEATPSPHSVNAPNLLDGETAVSFTPSRSVPPPALKSDSQPSSALGWDDSELEFVDTMSQTGSELGFSDKPPLHKRPFVWMLMLATVMFLSFGLIKMFASPGEENPPQTSMAAGGGGLPSVPTLKKQSKRKKKFPRRRRRPKRKVVDEQLDDVVKYQPPPGKVKYKPGPKTKSSFRLHLKSNPSGAEVFLSGQGKIDTTPCSLQFLSGSQVTLIVRKEGYLTKSVRWRAEGHQRVMVRLVRDPSQ